MNKSIHRLLQVAVRGGPTTADQGTAAAGRMSFPKRPVESRLHEVSHQTQGF